jgi:hypothetical protein
MPFSFSFFYTMEPIKVIKNGIEGKNTTIYIDRKDFKPHQRVPEPGNVMGNFVKFYFTFLVICMLWKL